MKEEHERAADAERQREVEKYREQIRYQQELERQLEEQEEKKQQAYEEFLKEKLMIDEIVRKIYEEDQRYCHILENFRVGLIITEFAQQKLDTAVSLSLVLLSENITNFFWPFLLNMPTGKYLDRQFLFR